MATISIPSLPASDAALRLGVSDKRVRALISAGAIEAEKVAGVWWIPVQSLARRVAVDSSKGGRPLNPESAWMLLLMASMESIEWGSPKVRRRVAVTLRERGLRWAFRKLGRRAERYAFVAHASELTRLLGSPDLMLTGVSAAGSHRLGLHGGEEVEAYVPVSALERVVSHHGLLSGGEGNVTLRPVSDELWAGLHRHIAPKAAVLTDLAEHPDARVRRVANEEAARLDRDRDAFV
ncbi:MAG TPA: hypothetical protein VGI76_03600 [Solirubrobacteraceae bacterium]|jgi:hypothetical protein